MKDHNWLCIGDGQSLDQWREHIIFNNYHTIIGSYHLLDDDDITLDYVAVSSKKEITFVRDNYPDFIDKIVTSYVLHTAHNIPKYIYRNSYKETLYSIQARYAIQQGATTITTVAWDWRHNSIKTRDCPLYYKQNPINTLRVDKTGRELYFRSIERSFFSFNELVRKKNILVQHKDLRHYIQEDKELIV